MALKLEDIARLSGVSRSTVSRVINGDEKVREETRRHVLAIVQQYNFQPNVAARRLAAGRTNIIGFVIPTGSNNVFTNPYFYSLIQGVSSECNNHDYSLMLWLTEPEFERRMIRQIINNGMVDGVIISSTLIEDPILNTFRSSNLPFVSIGQHPTVNINSVDIDNFTAALLTTHHLISSGHKHIRPATIAGPKNTLAGNSRLLGFLQAIKDAGIPYNPNLIVEGDFNETGGYKAMQQLLPFHPDAVFAANDFMAAGAFRAIKEAGLSIPEDIALTGFDDGAIAIRLEPSLTTTRQPIQQLGTQAVDLLIDIIQKPETQPRQIVLESELIIRASCGCTHSGEI